VQKELVRPYKDSCANAGMRAITIATFIMPNAKESINDFYQVVRRTQDKIRDRMT
jgi:hypothetical protein